MESDLAESLPTCRLVGIGIAGDFFWEKQGLCVESLLSDAQEMVNLSGMHFLNFWPVSITSAELILLGRRFGLVQISSRLRARIPFPPTDAYIHKGIALPEANRCRHFLSR